MTLKQPFKAAIEVMTHSSKCVMSKEAHEEMQTDSHGRCLGLCEECNEHIMITGRYTRYCPSCDCCIDCGCPNVDGFAHYQDCPSNYAGAI